MDKIWGDTPSVTLKSLVLNTCVTHTCMYVGNKSVAKHLVSKEVPDKITSWTCSPFKVWLSYSRYTNTGNVQSIKNLVVSLQGRHVSPAYFFSVKCSKSRQNRKWTFRRFKTALHDTVLHTDALCQISGSWPVWFPWKMWQKLSCEQICLCPQYSKWRKTGSGHAEDSKMRYMIQFSILMLCVKYQETVLCGSREKY